MQNRNKIISLLLGAFALSTLSLGGTSGCGSSSGGNGGTTDADFSKVTSLTITGVTTDSSFNSNGKAKIGFVAKDAEGNSVLANSTLTLASLIVEGGWSKKILKFNSLDSGVACTITSPSGTDCTLDESISSVSPSNGSSGFASATIIDDSGSMSSSDPDNDGSAGASPQRLAASKLYVDSVCADTTNIFGLFHYGVTPSSGFSSSSETSAIQDFSECSSANVTSGKAALDASIVASGSTPLYTSLKEVCESMNANSSLSGKGKSILLLSDGSPTDDFFDETTDCSCSSDSDCPSGGTCSSGRCTGTIRCDALNCIKNNQIITCTVGLGPGSELTGTCNADADCAALGSGLTCGSSTHRCVDSTTTCSTDTDCFGTACDSGKCVSFLATPIESAVKALKEVANEGSCTYAAASDPAALSPIFQAIGAAVSSGVNFVEFAVNNASSLASGTVVTGTLTVGTATATFTFVVP